MANKDNNQQDNEDEIASGSVFEELYSRLEEETRLKDIAEATALAERKRAESLEGLTVKLQADFDNFRKRTVKAQKKAEEDGIFKVLEKLLTIFDVMEQAKSMISDKKVIGGLDMVLRQLDNMMESFGVVEIPALGEDFDPNLHNAVQMAQAKSKDEAGKIIEVFNRGFRMGDRVLRHSVVKVAN